MFNSIWRRFIQWQSRKTPIKRRPDRARLLLEILEDRVTPSATTTLSGSTLTVNTTTGDSITVTNNGFQNFTFADSTGLINGASSYSPTFPITALTFNLGAGNNTLTLAGTPTAPIDLTGPTTTNTLHQLLQTTAGPDLTINGTSGAKTIIATDLFLMHTTAGLLMTLAGAGSGNSDNITFTDSNIAGSAVINNTGVGDTSFTIATSVGNTVANAWGSLSITNGTGSDINSISDTNFTGNVSIVNAAGSGNTVGGENTGQFGGSQTVFSAINYPNLLTVGGSLTISTTTGQTDTEVNDYNVHGLLSIAGGAGILNQTQPNVVGVDDNQTNNPTTPASGTAIPGIPTFGSISITSGAFAQGLNVYVGTNSGATVDYPLIVATTLSISATGTTSVANAGPVNMVLNDLTVDGAATLGTSATTTGDTIDVDGDAATSTFGALTINSLAIGTNTVNLQQEIGTLKVLGALAVNFGAGTDTLLVGLAGSPAVPAGPGGHPAAIPAVPPGTVTAGGSFGVGGTGGSKTITVVGATFGGMNWALTDPVVANQPPAGTPAETALFTDTNVTGIATINNASLIGATSFTIQISKNNTTLLNTWGSLSITNGAGSDINNITDTDFTGSVSIINGAGTTATGSGVGQSTGLYGGSHTTFSDDTNGYNVDQLTIAGSLTITTATGQSDTEVQDYNVGGNVTLGAGAGITNQTQASIIGLEDSQTLGPKPTGSNTPSTSGIPIIGGSVTLTGAPVAGTTLTAVVGTGIGNFGTISGDFPLIIGNGINSTITGAGTVGVTLNDLAVTGSSNLSLAATGATSSDSIEIQETNGIPTSYGPLTISAKSSNQDFVDLQQNAGTLNVNGALTVNFGLGVDNLLVGTANSNVNVTGVFGVTGSTGVSGSKIITALDDFFGGVSIALAGTGPVAAPSTLSAEITTFTDTDVAGAATIANSGVGNTSVTIDTSATTLNTWGSLSITDGAGSDFNNITDTDFAGNVTIANGAGVTGFNSTSQFAGSRTILSDNNNTTLLTIHGNLSITTTTDNSDTEVYDYNVHGTVTLGAGTGVVNQAFANIIGLEDNQTTAGSGIPVIGGNVVITGSTVPGPTGSPLTPGLIVALGTSTSTTTPSTNKNYPLILQGGLSVTTAGTGSANIDLNDLDLTAPVSTTTITLGVGNKNDLVMVQGSPTFTSVYDAFTVTATSADGTTLDLQDAAGNLDITGAITDALGVGSVANPVTLNLAADAGNPTGVTNAVIDLFGIDSFKATGTGNALFQGAHNINLFWLNVPTFVGI